ncbi:hypothetical protein PSACC_01623 [Paramicrosporidium saccamoebae]|uniref:Dienelactone hydrolase domain-containing protein n=1 Tax=Paramicrosporidium saccamoebae TaxID=1246581 RepID=A0A2H9TLF2_9FUNG|nr:hypothetical protein PSACC_01623 [Paramicrosporidium saccamoebae]
MKNISERFASAGFTALAPDLYRGTVATTTDEASHLMSDLNWDTAMTDVQSAVEYLRASGVKKTAAKLEETLVQHGVKYHAYHYDADHAFMNETRPEVFNKTSADLAFQRACDFLKSL